MTSRISTAAVCLLLIAALAASPSPSIAGVGTRPAAPPEPDSFGYRVVDQEHADCVFDFVDIEIGGTPIDFIASGAAPALDDGGALVTLSEPFEFYGTLLSSVVVSSNGYVAAASTLGTEDGGDFSNDSILPAIPDNATGIGARILAYHEELSGLESGGSGYESYFAACPRPSEAIGTEACTVIQWAGWAQLGGGNPFDLQTVLYHRSFEIVLQLRPGPSTLAEGTMGIQDGHATIGLQYRPDAGISTDTAICYFEPRFPPGGMQADFEVSNADTVEVATPGQPVTYEIGVLNRGPSPVVGAQVTDLLPAPLVACSWTCVASLGSSCSGSGSGDIVDLVDLEPGGWADYLLTCDTAPLANAVQNTVSAVLPAGVTDPIPANNSATDVNLVGAGSLPPLLELDRSGTEVVLSWAASCLLSDVDYAVYSGALGDFTSHEPAACSSGGALDLSLPVPESDRYYLVVPTNLFSEGSYGSTGAGTERIPALASCFPQAIGACP